MEPGVLAKELRERGLVILAVAEHRDAEDVLVVYLHGNAGQWVDGIALMTVADVPGVLSVIESVQTPSILLVQVQPMTGGDALVGVWRQAGPPSPTALGGAESVGGSVAVRVVPAPPGGARR